LRQYALALRHEVRLAVQLDFGRVRFGANRGEDHRRLLAVAELAEDPFDPSVSDRREELFQVQIDDHFRADVRLGVADDRPASAEPVRGGVDLGLFQDVGQDPMLRGLQARHRRGDQPLAAGLLGDQEPLIVVDRRGRPLEGQEPELGDGGLHRLGHRLGGREGGQTPGFQPGLVRFRPVQPGRDARA
jgi:hypothetical protein